LIVQLAASGLPHADPFKSRHSSHAGQKGDISERQLMAQSGRSQIVEHNALQKGHYRRWTDDG
jgi:hypothetical protein